MSAVRAKWCVFIAFVALTGTANAAPGIDPAAELRRASIDSKSDAVLVFRHGKPIFQYPATLPDAPMPLRSITKSVVSLAIGLLLDDKKIASLDSPLSTWFPE